MEPWYKSPKTRALYCHLLVVCNAQESFRVPFRDGYKILGSGQYWTTIRRLASESGLSVQETRTALKALQISKTITQQKSRQGTIITISNWQTGSGATREVTHKQHTTNTKVTPEQEERRKKSISVTKDKKPSELLQLERYYQDRFLSEVGMAYPRTSVAKDRSLLKGVLKTYTLAEAKDLVDEHFKDPWAQEQQFSIGVFVATVPKLLKTFMKTKPLIPKQGGGFGEHLKSRHGSGNQRAN